MHALPSRARAVLALLVLALLALPATVASAVPPERSLTVMSYNIHHGVGEDDVLDLDRIADVIAESGADVVALQEVDRHWSARSDLADQAEVLGELLDMHVAYGANLDRDPAEEAQPRRQYGTAILSTYPILDSDNTLLPNLGGEQRGLLEARINVRGRQALVYSTHLQHDSATERAAQTEAIVDLVGDATLPVVLTGDLNATPDATEMTRIVESFVDSHVAAGDGDGFTYSATDPDRRIDYVVANDHVRFTDSDVVDTLASDHLPVVADLVLTDPYADVVPLDRAHAHNDYEHRRPLFDALHHGFTSVEADIWLVDGELLVAHDADEVQAGRTLQSLYLDPLQDIVRANHGSVYPDRDEPIQLLVDIKSDGASTWEALEEALRPYRRMLSRFGRATVDGAVEVVVSGNRPRELMAAERMRWTAYDGRLSDLAGDLADPSFMPLVSDNWTSVFDWRGEGNLPADEQALLDDIVATAHGNDQRVRFWATPDQPGPARDALWQALVDADVDHLNTDDLAGLEAFLLAQD